MPYSIKKRPALLFSIISLLVMILVPIVCFAQADKIFRENSKAVVVVMVYDGTQKAISQGSGFIVRHDGVIVTNYHVISNAKKIGIKAGKKTFHVDGIINLDKENDVAILKVSANNLPIVKLGDFEKTPIGGKIYVISSPQGLENTISDGILSGKREVSPDRKILQITAPISPGSSGGPVFNLSGQVIGVATFLLKDSQNLNFAMPVVGIMDKITGKRIVAMKESQIENYEKTVEYWFNIGVAYGNSGRDREAVDAYIQVIRIKPDAAGAYNNLGIAYGKLGMYREAIETLKQAIRINPDYATTHGNLGVAYANSGRNQEAVEAYKQAIRINPDDALTHYNLGNAYSKLGMDREAVEAYKQAIRINPDYTAAYNNLGNAYGRLDMDREAVEAYKQAVLIKPNDAEAHYNLGLSHLILKDRNSALGEYSILKNLDPQFANKLFNVIYK